MYSVSIIVENLVLIHLHVGRAKTGYRGTMYDKVEILP